MALAGKITYMSEGMGIYRVLAILNKVPSEKVKQKMIEELNRTNVKVIGMVGYDPELNEAGFEGRAPGETKARREMETLVGKLLAESN